MIKTPSFLLLPFLVVQVLIYSLFPLQVHAQKKLIQLDAGTIQEVQTEKVWQVNRSRKINGIWDVQEYLDQLNQGKYSDWRLPTREELFELFSIFDLKNHGEIELRLEGAYWLVDETGNMFTGAWEIGDQCGPTRTFYKSKSGYIRAIRP